MAEVWMSQARTLKDLGIGILIVALGRWLDDVINWSVLALPPPKVVLSTPITIVVVAVAVVVAPIITAVVMMPIIMPVIWADFAGQGREPGQRLP
jgi:hypothetical protein